MKNNIILRNILAVIAGIIIGSIVNMGLIMVGTMAVPAPDGADVSTMEGLKEAMHLFKPINFLFPFLAHTLGTLVGAIVAALIAGSRKMLFAIIIGFVFLLGGIYNVINLPSPLWFSVLDLVVAYIPMGLLGGKIGGAGKNPRVTK